ncbi:MAG TPA: hypothetical protein VGG70_05450 [Candidatus Cybelea sp.]|jgi:hypothetical protein
MVATVACLAALLAQAPAASPMPSASPAPSASPRALGLQVTGTFAATFLDQNTSGPGQIGPEVPAFLNNSPLAPNTPYDTFSTAPLTPGIAGIAQALVTLTERTKTLDIGLDTGLEFVGGSITNAAYWGENMIPTINPHMGSQALPYAVTFPTAPGQDDGSNFRLSILGGSVATADGNLALKAGYFDLTQTSRFVFAQPLLTNVNPAIAYAPAESLSSGLPGADDWQPLATQLPLNGADVVAKQGIATFELTNAALPSPPGASARTTIGSLVFDHGEGTVYTLEALHATTAGTPFVTSVAFGANPLFFPTPQGVVAESTLSGQQQTIIGASANVHVMPQWDLDGTLEIARAWYDAQNVAMPATSQPGGYYHLGFAKTFGRATASVDAYRWEPRYATMVLPYGVEENQWGATWAWPAPWLGSSYQLVDNSVVGVNRQGYRLRYFVDKGPLEVHLEFADFQQIESATTLTSQQMGFFGGYFAAQLPGNATLGRQQRYGVWIAWHPSFGDLTLDYIDDQFSRPYRVATDNVALDVPQTVLTYSRHFSRAVIGAIGIGRYQMTGNFAEPVSFYQQLFFAGAIVRETPQASILATFRRNAFAGISSFPPMPLSPNFTGSQFIVEQRYSVGP